jgi:hypothetical protein
MNTLVNIADLVDQNDPEGRSYRQVNAAKEHQIPIGTLVEMETGVRLFVVKHTRDCDMTPLYCMSADSDDTEEHLKGFANRSWLHGYGEDGLTIVPRRL